MSTALTMTDRSTLTAEVLATESEWAAVESSWNDLCRRHGGLEVLFQSPEWFAHLGRVQPEGRRRVIVVRDDERRIVALAALHEQVTALKFDVGARELGGYRLRAWVLLGGEPLAPPDRRLLDAFFAALVGELGDADCIMMPMLVRGSQFHTYVTEFVATDRGLLTYAPAIPGGGRTHALEMEGTFDKYAAAHFNSKQRGNMRRHLKVLERELGPARLRRFAAPEEVEPFLADARIISRASWQYAAVGPHFETTEDWQRKLDDLARRGVLRSYILYAAERPLAFVLGYQRSDVFYHVKTGYDRSLSKLAPGIAILSSILDDLGKAGRPQRVNFMFGDTEYKREFANVHHDCDELMLLPRNLGNVIRCRSHAAFRAAVVFARDRVRRLAPLRRASVVEPPAS